MFISAPRMKNAPTAKARSVVKARINMKGMEASSVKTILFIIPNFLAKKLGMIKSIVFTELASIPFMLILAFTTDLAFAVGAFFIRGALMNMAQPISTHFAMEAVEEKEHPLINSLIALAWTLSWVFSAGLGGRRIELYSFAPPLVIAAGFFVASSALYYYYFAKEEKKIFKSEAVSLQETG